MRDYLAEKYSESWGIKDATGYTGGNGVVSEISESAYNTSTEYDYKFKVVYGYTEKELYTNPTDPVIPANHRYQAYTYEDGWFNTTLPWYWKDCRTTGRVITGISYRYYGVKLGGAVTPVTEKKTFLVQKK